ncbi:hypothetical protein ACFV3R_25200 [Streptomyces sp. NPDC059740]|uniref:hypothetical protein n=1 Tax=Streptomyces sp. NPDC059740 TaxID=3346926 RepID=UPI003656020B
MSIATISTTAGLAFVALSLITWARHGAGSASAFRLSLALALLAVAFSRRHLAILTWVDVALSIAAAVTALRYIRQEREATR